MATTPDKDAQGPVSVEKRRGSSSSKLVASGDRGATGKARLEFRKGFYNKEAKNSLGSSSTTNRSRFAEQENSRSPPKTETKTFSTPTESPTVNGSEANSPLPVPRNLGTEFLSVERTPEPESMTSKESSQYKLIAIIVLTASIFVAFTYYSPTAYLPFCDSNGSKVVEDCRPCPNHGTCIAGELTCDQGFVESGGKCVKDKEFHLLAKEIRNRLEKILRQRAGMVLCEKSSIQREMDSSQLYKAVESSFGSKNETRFHLAFREALSSIVNDSVSLDKFECREVEGSLWCQALHPSIPLSCRLRLFVLKEWWKLLVTVLLIIGAIRLYFWFRLKRWIDTQVKTVTEEVYRQLTESAQLTSPLSEKKKIVVTRLRDDLLHAHSLLKWKDTIWGKVVERINDDSRVLKSRQIVNDLPQLVWEWHDKMVS